MEELTLPQSLDLSTKFSVGICTTIPLVKKITDEITNGKSPSVNLLSVIFCPLIIKKYYY